MVIDDKIRILEQHVIEKTHNENSEIESLVHYRFPIPADTNTYELSNVIYEMIELMYNEEFIWNFEEFHYDITATEAENAVVFKNHLIEHTKRIVETKYH